MNDDEKDDKEEHRLQEQLETHREIRALKRQHDDLNLQRDDLNLQREELDRQRIALDQESDKIVAQIEHKEKRKKYLASCSGSCGQDFIPMSKTEQRPTHHERSAGGEVQRNTFGRPISPMPPPSRYAERHGNSRDGGSERQTRGPPSTTTAFNAINTGSIDAGADSTSRRTQQTATLSSEINVATEFWKQWNENWSHKVKQSKEQAADIMENGILRAQPCADCKNHGYNDCKVALGEQDKNCGRCIWKRQHCCDDPDRCGPGRRCNDVGRSQPPTPTPESATIEDATEDEVVNKDAAEHFFRKFTNTETKKWWPDKTDHISDEVSRRRRRAKRIMEEVGVPRPGGRCARCREKGYGDCKVAPEGGACARCILPGQGCRS